ncbi:hypothetical protein KUTeg_004947 [Tegillarca granosa]|uniref:Uncharacterized protein n=1 Tax=Tegillarca granosa TaxID=220873 RepID=A0ABQ9FID2_TEGGR|nr:hypothetical protein KUTeg_004947 [Tegillarca granosa]
MIQIEHKQGSVIIEYNPNSWGKCPNGKGGVGCGPQEEFYGCADIAILDDCTGVVDGSRDVTASDANKNTNGGGSNVGGNSWNDVPDNDEEIDCEEL